MFEILGVEDASKKVGVNQAFCSEAIGHSVQKFLDNF